MFFAKNAFVARDDNVFTRGKSKMTGVINASSSSVIDFDKVKKFAKQNQLTINDLVMSSLSSAMHEYLEGKEHKISICLPANVRFEFYQKYQDIKLENKFSVIPLTIPLKKTMQEAYPVVTEVSRYIKSSVAYMYCSYAMTFWSSLLLPRMISQIGLHNASMQLSFTFSNNPGPIKFMTIKDEFGNNGSLQKCFPYIVVSGRIGMTIGCMSIGPNLQITITADESICKNPERIVRLMQMNIESELATLKSE